MLEILGLDEAEECAYEMLLQRPSGDVGEIADACGLSTSRTRTALAGLEAKGLASNSPGTSRIVPVPPDIGVTSLISRRQQELEHARATANDLIDKLRQLAAREATSILPQEVEAPAGVSREEARFEHDDEIIRLLAAGFTDETIARRLGLGMSTVQRHVRRIMDSLGARSRFQAGVQAVRLGRLSGLI